MPQTTKIENAAWAVVWDADAGRQVYARDIDIVFTGDAIVHVGPGHEGATDRVIDGRERLVMPGLINLHSHPQTEPAYKGIREEHGVPAQYMTGLYERSLAFRLDEDGRRAGAELSYADLLASGVTTLVELSAPMEGWLDLLADSGLRAVVGPGFQSARWRLENAWELLFEWDEAAGRRGLEAALALIEEAERHPSGRLSGIVFPAQIETCDEALFRDAFASAEESGRPFTTHISQSVVEFNEIVRRHGKTPVQFAADLGILAPRSILGHCMFIDQHSSLHWHGRRDLALLAESGATVAHCPSPFARYGETLEDIGAYRRAGVALGLGTDVAPHNLLEEMRLALILSHVASKDIHASATGDLIEMATVGGARALGRDDLGRLAAGAKADIVLVDLAHPAMRPVRDPLKSLIYHAADRAVRDVFVDGHQVVAAGRVLGLDPEDAAFRLEAAQARMIEKVPELDYARRRAEQIAPFSLPLLGED